MQNCHHVQRRLVSIRFRLYCCERRSKSKTNRLYRISLECNPLALSCRTQSALCSVYSTQRICSILLVEIDYYVIIIIEHYFLKLLFFAAAHVHCLRSVRQRRVRLRNKMILYFPVNMKFLFKETPTHTHTHTHERGRGGGSWIIYNRTAENE